MSDARRLGGLDLVRGLAVVGMVAVNYGLILAGGTREPGDLWMRLLSLPAGDASATFVVLAGVGLALRSGGAEVDRTPGARWGLARRAISGGLHSARMLPTF